MKTTCPNCGAEVEFRFDDSFVRVCEYCRAAVLRTDRGIETLGQVADLVPLESPLRLFAEGHFGSTSFLLVGMAQIRHAAGGMWQEWYAKLDGGRWGWLAEAQGRYYLTFEQAGAAAPPRQSLSPGQVLELPAPGGRHAFTVAEVTTGTYVAAAGELPYRLVPDGTFHYADLADGQGQFATIDYGEDGDPPAVYVGTQVTLSDLGIHGGEVAPGAAAGAAIPSRRLACPSCNAPVDVRLPGESLRVVCAHCNSVLDVESDAAKLVEKLATRATPAIPLGTKGAFAEGELTVIGYLQRSALADDTWWPFEEYLLHAPQVGFRWLVQSDGHWSYVQPVATGAVTVEVKGASYDGVRFRQFQWTPLKVDQVLGELYWRVRAGEQVDGRDFVAPPAMLSCEANDQEVNWSLSTYLTIDEVQHAFGDRDLPLGMPTGVAPNQPCSTASAANLMTIGFLALLLVGLIAAALAPGHVRFQETVTVPSSKPPPSAVEVVAAETMPTTPTPTPAANPNVSFSEPFQLAAGENVELALRASLANDWLYTAADLVEVATGKDVSLEAELEHYSGYEDGDHWSEGSPDASRIIGPVASGAYVLRLESQHGGRGTTTLSVQVRQGVFHGRNLLYACLVLGIPLLGLGIHAWSFERKRWDNSTEGQSGAPKTPIAIVVLVLFGLFTLLGVLLKAMAEASDD